MTSPGQSIPVDSKTREALGIEVSEVITSLEDTYAPLFEDIKIWWRQYEAIPRIKGSKNFPFKGASNVVVPLTQIMVDSLVNRAFAAIFGHGRRIWTAKTENEADERKVKNVARHINYAASNNDFNLRMVVYDWLQEICVIGSSVIALNWRDDVRWAYTGRGSSLKAQRVRWARGAFPEHIPRHLVLWDTNHLIQEAPVVVREFEYTWGQLRSFWHDEQDTKSRSELNSWDKEVIQSLRGKGTSKTGRSQVVEKARDEWDSKAPRDFQGFANTHDIREVHLDWPMLNAMGFSEESLAIPGKEKLTTPSPPLVATIDRNSRQILRLIAAPYHFPYKPFFDGFYRKRSGRGHSVGIAKKLEHMQLAMTTSLNQAFDARTRANAIWGRTSRSDFLKKPIDPAHMIYDPTMNSVAFENLPTSTFDDMRLMTAIQNIAERQVGQSDANFGRETRQGGHPSPATSTLALLEQSDLMSGTMRELIRMQLSRLGEAIATLYQQFETDDDGKLQRIFGERDAQDLKDFIFPTTPISGNLDFDLVAMSENLNPDTEMKRAVLVTQMNTNYWAFVARAMQFLATPNIPPQLAPAFQQMAIQSIKAQTKAHERFLEAGDIDDLEQFVLQLGQNQDTARQDTGGLALGPGQPQANGGVVPPGGVAGNGAVPPNGAAGPPGGIGGLG